jgi:hypothetical protein
MPLVAWLSTVTILIPVPWAVDQSWLKWTAALLMVLGGVATCAVALRPKSLVTPLALMSCVYIVYWASEYLLAIRPISVTFNSVIYAIDNSDTMFGRLVLAQTQIVLPFLHIVLVVWFGSRIIASYARRKGIEI